MNTTFHVYEDNNTPVTGLINLDEDQLLKKISEKKIDFNKHEVVRVEQEEYNDASY
tara:strand:- start:1056 stop:1223 length:168 start_codon:yes stop_codon:yes gene_type:complete